MPAKNHPEYKQELDRLDYTLNYVEKSLTGATEQKSFLDEDITRKRRHYNSESSQSYIELMIGTMMKDRTELRFRNLTTARSKPYFARIDFQENEKEHREKLYIGKMALIREEDQELIIVDWRAPVANLYYEERLGEAGYYSPDGSIQGQMLLKRQFSIDEGKLNEIFDIDITTSDDFLQASLGANADNRLKEIVSTIQAEQNRVIRADMWMPLIVQGAAGGGKTTIALHRIAYLIYTYEKTFNPENFMIIAPTRFFLNYISDVLPELGVERTKQTTFEDFAMELIGQKFKLRDTNEKLTIFVNNNNSEEQRHRNELIMKESKLKCSMLFKELLDDYISILEEDFIPREAFMLGSRVIISYEEINKLFLNDYRKLPIVKRIDEIKKHLANRLKYVKEELVRGIDIKCDRRIVNIKNTMEETEERRQLITETIDKKYELLSKIELHAKTAVKDYIKKISKTNPFKYYKDLIFDNELLQRSARDMVEQQTLDFLREYSMEVINSGHIELEDIAPIIYLKFKIYGVDEKIPVKHIVIDEAQDFSVFQLYVLKSIIKDSSFTILGDLSQGIHSYRGIEDWKDVSKYVFVEKCKHLTMEQSYRTTVEIMDGANKVIANLKNENLVPAKPVIRHGEPVRVIKKENKKEIAKEISEKIKVLKKEGFKSIAIICKTADECSEMHSYFKKGVDTPYIITGKEKEYKSGIVIVPSYLAKGLEFDAVFVANAEKENYTESELDIKLLYVAMTRPLHRLDIYYCGELTNLLSEV